MEDKKTELEQKDQQEVSGGKSIRTISPEEQIARLVIALRAGGKSKEEAEQEIARKLCVAPASIRKTIEQYW